MITLSKSKQLKYAIGVDLGGSFIKSGVVDSNGKIIAEFKTDTFAEINPKKVIGQIEKNINHLKKKFRGDISGIGIGAPGIVRDGKVHFPPNFKNWKIVDLKKDFSKKFKLKVEVDNDANCATLAELKFGTGKKIKNFLFLTLGTGIGGGIVIDGKLYRGEANGAGEFGMTTINFEGPKCLGGNNGSVESYIGRNNFLKLNQELLWKINRRNNLDFDKMAKLTSKGNKDSKEFFKRYGFYLGIGITNYFNLMDVRTAILSGGISNAYKYFIRSCNETVKERCLPTIKNEFRILRSKINNNAGVLGAASLALQDV